MRQIARVDANQKEIMESEISFVIPHPTPSNNALKGINRFKYKAMREDWVMYVKEAYHLNPQLTQCNVIIDRYGSLKMDWDNLYGGVKPLMDALIIAGVIADDNPDVVSNLRVTQSKSSRKDARTHVLIRESCYGFDW